ncbi:MAG: Asp-tRNA(Asn)/Glu-tRNA(Gln) amidotransferase subunit GatB [candidate division KSB1 bacterium]|nr:Asp-tRNA(Asn)/Glu-tRNA(Gln) amidotransferase subunit GatB [candidate division KSB1 bacterium]MDZ7366519.1 Asp-tRNA(Asn)/Glu-tRNA(Gln) amidotransferase subunit GatB [candidate division KSB1 bacterium]MDZ7404519.1 Asp-tRNA(Asn)/Glu-tRNA(Gln) amidotransferase subunit GatB [candidate division KSB1 bacterium]
MKYEPIIGLEVHAQLLTVSKIFCGCGTVFGAPQNSQVCPVCLGLPGVLPVLNRQAVEFAIKMGLATNCRIAEHAIFARKNYFYPDLPKGYQISQYEEPLCENGWIEIEQEDGALKRVGIIRIHLEEDAGKSVHAEEYVSENETLIDLNRCGTPLIEIVSEPDIRSPREAYLYLTRIRQLVRYLGICDGNMEEGSLRCDANISVRPAGEQKFGVKTELKNMNSFRHVEKALEFEINRQIQLLESGGAVVQQTLLWDATNGKVTPMRSKEQAHDYRYFPEPDLAPLRLDENWREQIRLTLPELPIARRNRFVEQFGLPKYDADVLTDEKAIADYFEAAAELVQDKKLVSNWVMGEVLRVLKEKKIDVAAFQMTPAALAELLNLIANNTISGKIAKEVFDAMLASGKSAKTIVAEKGLVQVSDASIIEKAVDEIIAAHPKEVERYRSGEEKVFGFLVGQLMKAMRGKANPKVANEILKKKLS